MWSEIVRLLSDEAYLMSAMAGLPALILLVLIAICVFCLSKGADWMVDGAVGLAHRIGLPKILIGATIISVGTTAPEVSVSVTAAWMGNPGLALGNGVGSIIANTGLIFGLACIIRPIPMNRYVLNRTGWLQDGTATVLVVMALIAWLTRDTVPVLPRWFGIFYLILLVSYIYYTYAWARKIDRQAFGEDETVTDGDKMSMLRCGSMITGGLFLVIVGARILIPCALEVAQRIGVPEDVIAATMVAFGTSLPELVTVLVAVRKGHSEIAVGNIIGANILNCLFVVGASAAVTPLGIPKNFYIIHFPTLIVILYAYRLFVLTDKRGFFKRWQGGILMGLYCLYLLLQYLFKFGAPA